MKVKVTLETARRVLNSAIRGIEDPSLIEGADFAWKTGDVVLIMKVANTLRKLR